MNIIRFVKTCWRWRDTPIEHLIEIHELIVMAARRCAYDLKHASAEIKNQDAGEFYETASQHWLNIFNCANMGKEYRHRLHREIMDRDHKLQQYRNWLEEQEIEDPYPDDIPF